MSTVKYGKIELPSQPIGVKAQSSTRASFTVEPFERGYAHTVGNALRRIMLTSIEAPAIVSVQIEGFSHEICADQGIKEDMTRIVLNLKTALLNRPNTDEHANPREIHVVNKLLVIDEEMIAGKQFDVTMGTLFGQSEFKVVDPDHVIFTATKPMKRNIVFKVATGRGYVPSERQPQMDKSIHEIIIDSCFSPVRLVNYQVENTRVGQDTDFDKLILEVVTDGRVTPSEALSHAAQIAIQHFEVFKKISDQTLQFDKGSAQTNRDRDEFIQKLAKPIVEIELSVRSTNCLHNAQIETIYDLVKKDEADMLKYRNFGKKSLTEIRHALERLGLFLGMKTELDSRKITEEDVKKFKQEKQSGDE